MKPNQGGLPMKKEHVHKWVYVSRSYPIEVYCDCGEQVSLWPRVETQVPIRYIIGALNRHEREKGKKK